MYVCTAGFVAVWNIEHQAKEFELKGMWVFDAILILILSLHPFPKLLPCPLETAHESDVLAITFNPGI